jgi:hypothetical protein
MGPDVRLAEETVNTGEEYKQRIHPVNAGQETQQGRFILPILARPQGKAFRRSDGEVIGGGRLARRPHSFQPMYHRRRLWPWVRTKARVWAWKRTWTWAWAWSWAWKGTGAGTWTGIRAWAWSWTWTWTWLPDNWLLPLLWLGRRGRRRLARFAAKEEQQKNDASYRQERSDPTNPGHTTFSLGEGDTRSPGARSRTIALRRGNRDIGNLAIGQQSFQVSVTRKAC